MENYGFILDWYELPEELREAKIDEQIVHSYAHSEWEGNPKINSEEDALENLHVRDEVEESIRCHFPIYF